MVVYGYHGKGPKKGHRKKKMAGRPPWKPPIRPGAKYVWRGQERTSLYRRRVKVRRR